MRLTMLGLVTATRDEQPRRLPVKQILVFGFPPRELAKFPILAVVLIPAVVVFIAAWVYLFLWGFTWELETFSDASAPDAQGDDDVALQLRSSWKSMSLA